MKIKYRVIQMVMALVSFICCVVAASAFRHDDRMLLYLSVFLVVVFAIASKIVCRRPRTIGLFTTAFWFAATGVGLLAVFSWKNGEVMGGVIFTLFAVCSTFLTLVTWLGSSKIESLMKLEDGDGV